MLKCCGTQGKCTWCYFSVVSLLLPRLNIKILMADTMKFILGIHFLASVEEHKYHINVPITKPLIISSKHESQNDMLWGNVVFLKSTHVKTDLKIPLIYVSGQWRMKHNSEMSPLTKWRHCDNPIWLETGPLWAERLTCSHMLSPSVMDMHTHTPTHTLAGNGRLPWAAPSL